MDTLTIWFDEAITKAHARLEARDVQGAWSALEEAHILGQTRALLHLRAHWHMAALAVRTVDAGELAGQLLRLAFAIPTALLGEAPLGNTGRAADGHAPMPLAPGMRERLLAAGVDLSRAI